MFLVSWYLLPPHRIFPGFKIKLVSCLSYFSVAMIKYQLNNLRGKGLTLAHSSKVPIMGEGVSRQQEMEHLVMLYLQWESREKMNTVLISISSFTQSKTPTLRMVLPGHSWAFPHQFSTSYQDNLSHAYSEINHSSQVHIEFCVLSYFTACWVDRTKHPTSVIWTLALLFWV